MNSAPEHTDQDKASKRLNRLLRYIDRQSEPKKAAPGKGCAKHRYVQEIFAYSAYQMRAVLDKGLEFIDAGANINATSPNGNSLLSLAITNGYPELVEKLIKRGANITGKNTPKLRPLVELAAEKGYPCLKSLLSASQGPLTTDEIKNRSAALWIVLCAGDTLSPTPKFEDKEKWQMVKLLLIHGADIEGGGAGSRFTYNTPLLHAASKHDHQIVLLLGLLGSNLEAYDTSGATTTDIITPRIPLPFMSRRIATLSNDAERTSFILELLPAIIENRQAPEQASQALAVMRVKYRLKDVEHANIFLGKLNRKLFAKTTPPTWTAQLRELFRLRDQIAQNTNKQDHSNGNTHLNQGQEEPYESSP